MKNPAGRPRRKIPEVNIVPLVDVFTALIFFFLITMQFKQTHSADISLPEMSAVSAAAAAENPAAIGVSEGGEFYFGEKKLTKAELEAELKRFAEQRPDSPVAILADKRAKVESFAEVFDAARSAKIKKLIFRAVPKKKAAE